MQGFSFTINGVGLCGNYRFYLLTPLETAMSNNDKDTKKVSDARSDDFVRGLLHGSTQDKKKPSLLMALAVGFIIGRGGRK